MGKHIVHRKILNLQFEDPEMQGLQVRARAISFGRMLTIADQAEAAKGGAGIGEVTEFVTEFVGALLSWNAADEDGADIPADRDGLYAQDWTWSLAVMIAWFDAMTAVPRPLERTSPNGSRFPEVSIPMEIPSPSLPN